MGEVARSATSRDRRGTRAHPGARAPFPPVFCVAILLAACTTAQPLRTDGQIHVVRRGENLYRIGKAYGMGYEDLARLNGVADPSKIEVGQKIFVPGARRQLPVEVITPESASEGRPPDAEIPRGSARLRWPIRSGRLTSSFGPRGASFHDGIDVAASEGTAIYAAASGRVVYSDQLAGYGNIVIVDHGGSLTTVYAHNAANVVRKGDRVMAGQLVSRLGRTGRTTGANLHFEVRSRNVARNPLYYLVPKGTAGIR